MTQPVMVGGIPTPLKNDGLKVSWGYDIPNIWKVIKIMFQTTNQSWLVDRFMAKSDLLSQLLMNTIQHPAETMA